jgi:hypothetical protein
MKPVKLDAFLKTQSKGNVKLFGVYSLPDDPTKVRIFLWMEGYDCFHRVFVDLPKKGIESVEPTEKYVRHFGELLNLVKITFTKDITNLFTVDDLFNQLESNCIILPGQEEDDTKARKADLVDRAVPRQRGQVMTSGARPFSRPIV